MFPGSYLQIFIKIGSVTAEILLALSFCGAGWWGVQSHFIVKPNLVLRLGWGFDNLTHAAANTMMLQTKSKLHCFGQAYGQNWTLFIISVKSAL